jgi:hypothetical protein
MRIKLADYNHLDIHTRASLLSDAVVVDNLMKNGKGYSLYTYGSYYIEVQFDIKTSYLLNITAFAHGHRLDKYIERIKLRECI